MIHKQSMFVLCLLLGLCANAANAAVTCVFNKATGTFEAKGGDKSKQGECDLPAGESPFVTQKPKAALPRVIKESETEMTMPGKDLPVARVDAPAQVATIQAPATSHQWTVKPTHHSIRELFEDWGAEAGYEVIFETRDFPLQRTQETVISSGDIWAALTIIGESYRFSDAAFQVQPTKFKQIVIVPMGKSSNNTIGSEAGK